MVKKQVLILPLFTLAALLAACSSNEPAGQRQDGERLFAQHCAACHTTSGDTVIVGPALAGIAVRAETRVAGLNARAYIEQSILDPSGYVNEGFSDLMPKTFGQVLSLEELNALIEYLMTLR